MKIRNIINSTIALFMVLTFASCDALDLKPISFITNESFWQTEDDVKGALNGIYVDYEELLNMICIYWGKRVAKY